MVRDGEPSLLRLELLQIECRGHIDSCQEHARYSPSHQLISCERPSFFFVTLFHQNQDCVHSDFPTGLWYRKEMPKQCLRVRIIVRAETVWSSGCTCGTDCFKKLLMFTFNNLELKVVLFLWLAWVQTARLVKEMELLRGQAHRLLLSPCKRVRDLPALWQCDRAQQVLLF